MTPRKLPFVLVRRKKERKRLQLHLSRRERLAAGAMLLFVLCAAALMLYLIQQIEQAEAKPSFQYEIPQGK